jgi:ABC-type nitrate/sulfonate/bicarbonate transport system substrate-binding protein
MLTNILAQVELDVLLNAGVSNSSTTTASTGKDISQLTGVMALAINARSGGTGTVTVAIEHSDALASGYAAVDADAILNYETGEPVTLATFSNGGYDVVVGLRTNLLRRYIRVTFAGTSLTQNYSVTLVAQKKYGS